MSSFPTKTPLSQKSLSVDHQSLINTISKQKNLLIIQDLDGVCMELVKDPLTRKIDPEYMKATKALQDHFFVLTNGEHIGKRGVNGIVNKAFNNDVDFIKEQGFYLPGLAGGGVQWQDCYGNVSHPGISDRELDFLAQIPHEIETCLHQFFAEDTFGLSKEKIKACIDATILDNKVSPTANLNVFYDVFSRQPEVYSKLQETILQLMDDLLAKAKQEALEDSFFIHYAPNLGRDDRGKELIQMATDRDSGTTDFQFMVKGAVKEVGVLVILNHYYYLQTGEYPLGKDFNARKVGSTHEQLVNIIQENFDRQIMPQIIGVGDTVTSKGEEKDGEIIFRRGGSDRGFLQLIQDLNQYFQKENIVVYIDSSQGEVKNRKPLKIENGKVIGGVGDDRDNNDPLTLNVVFPQGYQQYTAMLKKHQR